MYLITKRDKAYRAIPINATNDWGIKVAPDGKTDYRIILRINQNCYQLFTTHTIVWRDLRTEDLCAVCREIIAAIYDSILHRQDLIDVPLIAAAVENRYRLRQKLDPKTQHLVDYVRVEHSDIVLMDTEPPADVPQEELPY